MAGFMSMPGFQITPLSAGGGIGHAIQKLMHLPIGETDTAAAVTFAAERHDLKGKRTESQFAPLVNIQWDINDAAMSYFSARRGF